MGGLASDHGVMHGGVVGEEHASGGGGGQGEEGETSEGLDIGEYMSGDILSYFVNCLFMLREHECLNACCSCEKFFSAY